MNRLIIGVFLGLTLLVSCDSGVETQSLYADLYQDLPFDMPVLSPPTFPSNRISILETGGVGDGQFLNTDAFQTAFEKLTSLGGGTLYVPAGVWYTGPIVFQSNINLYLEEGAILLFSRNKDHYPLVKTSFEGLDTRRCQSPISGRNLANIAITGFGSIDGSGDEWRPVKRQKVTDAHWKKILAKGGVLKRDDYWFPSEGYLKGDAMSDMNVPQNLTSEEDWISIKDFLRPVMVSFIECKNVFLQGVTFSNSPSWNLHPLLCENVILDGVLVKNPSYAQNGDGLDLESCKNSIIVNSLFDVGDDGICIKSGKDEDGRRRGKATENVIVSNCKVFHGHGGFVVGSEMSGGVKNIMVRNCSFLGTDVGLRFKSRRGRGGVVENIYVEHVNMYDISTDALRFNMYYGGKSASESLAGGDEAGDDTPELPEVTEETPVFRGLHFKNVTSVNSRRAMYFQGLPEMPIADITLHDITLSSEYGAEFVEVDGLEMQNVELHVEKGEPFNFTNVKNKR